MKFTTYKYADISTAEIDESDLGSLLDEDAPFHLGNLDGRWGSLFYVPEDMEERVQSLKDFGFGEKFISIMLELCKQGVPFVRFDGDGAAIEKE